MYEKNMPIPKKNPTDVDGLISRAGIERYLLVCMSYLMAFARAEKRNRSKLRPPDFAHGESSKAFPYHALS